VNEHSRYGYYREIARAAKRYYDKGDLSGLRQELCSTSKYEYIIRCIDCHSTDSKILEVGCATGFLTSYFILEGYNIIGVDVSQCAIESARADFGPRFFANDAEIISENSPYDIIYHTGMIGCVSNPVELTRSLLSLLKPGGKLLFNAPNLDALWFRGQLWFDDAPPPDVVTLFKPGFWTRFFSVDANVLEEVENCSKHSSAWIALKRGLHAWKAPTPRLLEGEFARHDPSDAAGKRVIKKCTALAKKGIKTMINLCPDPLIPRQPTEVGLLVSMTKK
jgi:2-polyprenyl-3-methyl-5-hydroxy-6-metoxy-1,4-benzoquinol methylase